jgi:putative peptidoglycan lipid II flippase
MSRQAAQGDTAALIGTVSYGLRFIMVLLIPAAIFYILLGERIIAVALQRGAFTVEGTWRTSRVLAGYSLGLFSLGGFTFLQRFFYARHDFKRPLIAAVLVSVSDILLSLWLRRTVLRVTGLAVANSISFSGGFVLLLIWTRRVLGSLPRRVFIRTLGRMTVSLLPFAGFILVYGRLTRSLWGPGSSLANLVLLLIEALVAALILLFMYRVSGVEVVGELLKRRKRK